MEARRRRSTSVITLCAVLLMVTSGGIAGCDLDQALGGAPEAYKVIPGITDLFFTMDVEEDHVFDSGLPPE